MRNFITFAKYNWNDQVNDDEMGSACSTNGEKGENRNAYRILVEKPKGKIPLGGPRNWWVDNAKLDKILYL
jgi:hypothetical protein